MLSMFLINVICSWERVGLSFFKFLSRLYVVLFLLLGVGEDGGVVIGIRSIGFLVGNEAYSLEAGYF